jgi:DNA-binding CsgD family transcriptional regulator
MDTPLLMRPESVDFATSLDANGRRTIGSPRSRWSARLARRIPTLYTAGRLTVSEIAELEGITVRTVLRHLGDAPVQDRRRHDVAALRRRGLVPYAIADALGLSDRLVSSYLAQLEHTGKVEPVPSYLARG